jgi:hypothetical protein
MTSWMLAAPLAITGLVVIWILFRARPHATDLNPVSAQWLADQKRAADDQQL